MCMSCQLRNWDYQRWGTSSEQIWQTPAVPLVLPARCRSLRPPLMHKCPGLKLRGEWLGYLCVDYRLLHSASPQGLSFDSNTWSVASSILLFFGYTRSFFARFLLRSSQDGNSFCFLWWQLSSSQCHSLGSWKRSKRFILKLRELTLVM